MEPVGEREHQSEYYRRHRNNEKYELHPTQIVTSPLIMLVVRVTPDGANAEQGTS
jgi:hypothetical protein